MGCIARVFATIFGLIGLVTAVVALPLFAVQLVAFSPDTYIGALDRTQALQRLPDAGAAQLYLSLHYVGTESPADEGPGGAPPALRSLTEDQMRSLLRTLLPPEDLRPIADSFFRSVFAATGGAKDPVTISFASLKTRLSGGGAVDAYLQLMRAQPACSDAQLQEALAKAATDLPSCRPPEQAIVLLRPTIESTLAGLIAGIPDQRAMSDALSPDSLKGLQTARTALSLIPLVPILFLLLAAALAGATRRAVLRGWGIVLALVGGLIFAGSFNIASQFEQRWTASAASLPPYWSPSLVTLGHDVVAAIVAAVADGLVLCSGLVGLLGLALIVLAWRRTRPSAPDGTALEVRPS